MDATLKTSIETALTALQGDVVSIIVATSVVALAVAGAWVGVRLIKKAVSKVA